MAPTAATQRTPVRAAVHAGVIVAVGLAALLAVQWGIDGGGRVDFRIYHRAISSMTGGSAGGLYDYGSNGWNFLYPPAAALVLGPLTWLGEDAAAQVWLVISVIVGLVAFGLVIRRLDVVPGPLRPALVVAALWTVPAFLSFRMGQINPLIALLGVVDVAALQRRSRFGGVATGVAAALKVTPLLVVAMMFAGGRRRDAGRAVLAFAGVTTVGLVALPAETVTYWRHVVVGASSVGGVANPLNASLFSLTGLMTDHTAVQRVLWAAASALMVAAAMRGARRRWAGDVLGAVTIAVTLTYLVSPLTWVHHQWFATVALLVWLDRVRWHGRSRDPWQLAGVALGAFALLDPMGLGETSMVHTLALVAFGVATVVGLPTPANFPVGPPVPQDGRLRPEKRGVHV